uniref:Uncharacterized protein n=1 Tax=Anopheles farauti TaxID=69004 RepID=A0A182QIR6_9DIPT
MAAAAAAKKMKRNEPNRASAAITSESTQNLVLDAATLEEEDNVSPDGPFNTPQLPETNGPNEPLVLYEPSAQSYDSGTLDLPTIVKYQCIDEDMAENATGYQISENGCNVEIDTATAVAAAPAATDDESITVITLQNLDDQTHTTCIRTDVTQSLEPTLINELTPVEIKYDEYDQPAGNLVVTCDGTMVQDGGLYSAPAATNTLTQIQRSNTQQMIDWPPPPIGTETVPYVVYANMYGSCNGTVIIPDQLPVGPTVQNIKQQEQQEQNDVPPDTASEQNAPDVVMVNSGGIYMSEKTPKSESQSNPPECADVIVKTSNCEIETEEPRISENHLPVVKETVNQGEEEQNENMEEEMDEEDGDGGFSLEDIDLNSLVLVESQDAVDPNRTFYEIYISNPDTGQLSDKPLDVPADVIENIRQILEAGGGGGSER